MKVTPYKCLSIARIWSILVIMVILLMVIAPDPYATETVPAADWLLLSLYGVAVLGLIIAWRWRLAGGIITIVTLFARELAWVIIKGNWHADFLIIWLFVLPPAILFLLARRVETIGVLKITDSNRGHGK